MVVYSKKRQNMALFFKIETLKSGWVGDFYASVAKRADGEQTDGTQIYSSTQLFATEQDLKLEIFLSVGQQCFARTTSTAMRIQPISTLVPIAFNRLNQSAHTRSIAMNLRVVAPDSESDSSALLSSNPTSRSISNHDSIHSSSSNESSFWRFIFWRFDIFVCNQLLRKRFFYCSKQSQKAKEQSICKRQSGDIEETIHYSGDSREDCSWALLSTPAGSYINFWHCATALIRTRVIQPLLLFFTRNPHCPYFLNHSQNYLNHLRMKLPA